MTNISHSSDIDDIWKRTCLLFPILFNKIEPEQTTEDDWNVLVNYIKSANLDHYHEDLVLGKIEEILSEMVIRPFWANFSTRQNEREGFHKFKEAINSLYTGLNMFTHSIENLEILRKKLGSDRILYGEKSLIAVLKSIVRSTIHAQIPLNSQIIIDDFYKISFKVFCFADKSIPDHDESNEDLVQCEGCSFEIDQCQCNSIIEIFHDINCKLRELELLERLAGEVITSFIHVRIEDHVTESCKGSFDVSYISFLENWLDAVVMGWLTKVFNGDLNVTNLKNKETLRKFKHKLSHFLYETYTCTRIDQLFNIIIEYPDSQPAIEDLRICLAKTDLGSYLTVKLQRALETRLLHPGVNTPDVLTAYVAAIRALRQLDPTGVLLETVTKPVRHYLRYRDDTVRCVVTSLTEDGPSDLADELIRGDTLPDEDNHSDDDIDNWQGWQPDPVHADPTKPCKSKRSSDIISMLVNVYGSKELFVNEYRTLLADRLLSQFTYNTEKEIRYLELLKRRFGESQLHFCEVMLKDVYDSKRINAILHSDPNLHLDKLEFPSTAMILSAQFWPPFKEETLELPSKVKEHLDIYTKAFETLKGNRTLCWKPHLGSVNIDIELKDRKLNLTVSPIQATIIWHFQTKYQWTIDELSQIMHVPSSVLRRKIAYWQSQGLLREISADTFLLVEENNSRTRGTAPAEVLIEDEETESVMASAHDQREEELQVFWSYIVGMLTNLDSLPLERIHQMLIMFASQGPGAVECSLHELRLFLDRKVREHKLLFTGQFYKLLKS